MKRVWCLYRVSKKKQVNLNEDIPMQKNACHEFVNAKTDWKITNELYEKGISGWSKTEEQRDELTVIREGAIKKDFDILLVFMFDRLGRREDETPFMVNFLVENGIEVWSVEEGQREIKSHTDKLLNFISFWHASGESLKTSIRVRETKKQLSEQGLFQGGSAPTGYKIIETNEPHWKDKDRKIKELCPDKDESEVVQLIFNLYVNRHYGYRKIADYLFENGFRTRESKAYSVNTIKRILENPIYIGIKRYNSFDGKISQQPYNQKLRIISDDLFYQAQEIRNERCKKIKNQDKKGIPLSGKLMFSGLAYCGFCESRLSGNYLYRDYNYNGEVKKTVIYRYRCPLNKGKRNCDHKKNIWGSKKYDKLIIERLKEVLGQLDLKLFIDVSVKQKKSEIKLKENNIKSLDKEYHKLKMALEKLNSEIALSLIGESKFSPEQLSGAINHTTKQIDENRETYNNIKDEISREKDNFSDVNNLANELDNWEMKFDKADSDVKKTMLSRIIDKVYLYDEDIDLELNIMLQEVMLNNPQGTSY